jgi:hypothetical protein
MEKWKMKYPYTMDKPLEEALAMALDNNDNDIAKKLWEIFISYRKSDEKLKERK